jgi:hypothetical protein
VVVIVSAFLGRFRNLKVKFDSCAQKHFAFVGKMHVNCLAKSGGRKRMLGVS